MPASTLRVSTMIQIFLMMVRNKHLISIYACIFCVHICFVSFTFVIIYISIAFYICTLNILHTVCSVSHTSQFSITLLHFLGHSCRFPNSLSVVHLCNFPDNPQWYNNSALQRSVLPSFTVIESTLLDPDSAIESSRLSEQWFQNLPKSETSAQIEAHMSPRRVTRSQSSIREDLNLIFMLLRLSIKCVK